MEDSKTNFPPEVKITDLTAQQLKDDAFYERLKKDDEYINTITRGEIRFQILDQAAKLKIKTEVKRRLDALDKELKKEGLTEKSKVPATPRELNVTDFNTPNEYPILSTGYEYRVYDDSIEFIQFDENGQVKKTEQVIKQGIIPVKRLKVKGSPFEKIRIAALDNFQNKRSWIELDVDRELIANARKAVTLSRFGLLINSENARHFVKYMDRVLWDNNDRIPIEEAAPRLGWLRTNDTDIFIPYDKNITFTGQSAGVQIEWFKPAGSFYRWRDICREPRKNLIFRLNQAASASSALLHPLGGLPFVLHTWGKSGCGKTVSLTGAASIWGKPGGPGEKGLIIPAHSTPNAILKSAGIMGSLPNFLDELETLPDKKQIGPLVYSFTVGSEKGRLNQNSEQQEALTWLSCALTTGEERIINDSSKAGELNRVIELEVGHRLFSDQLSTKIMDGLKDNYGYAGRCIIDFILNNKPVIRDKYNTFRNELLKMHIASKQAQSAAVILTGDFCLCKAAFENDTPLDVSAIAQFLNTEIEINISRRAYEWFINWVSVNQNRFRPPDTETGRNTGEVWGEVLTEGNPPTTTAKINTDVLKKEMNEKAGFNFDAVKNDWSAWGLLKKNSQGRFFQNTTVHGAKGRYYEIILK